MIKIFLIFLAVSNLSLAMEYSTQVSSLDVVKKSSRSSREPTKRSRKNRRPDPSPIRASSTDADSGSGSTFPPDDKRLKTEVDEGEGSKRVSERIVVDREFIYSIVDGKVEFSDDINYFPEQIDGSPKNSTLSAFYQTLAEFFLNREDPNTASAAKAYRKALDIMKARENPALNDEVLSTLKRVGVVEPLVASEDEIKAALDKID